MKTSFAACLLSALSSAVIIGTDPDAYCICELDHEPVLCEDGSEFINACMAACNGQTGCSLVNPPEDDNGDDSGDDNGDDNGDDDGDDEEEEDETPPVWVPDTPPRYNLPCNTQAFLRESSCAFDFNSYQDLLDHYDMDNNACPAGTGDVC